MLSRIPGLYALDARNNPECLQALQRHRGGGQKSSQLRAMAMIKHCLQPCVNSVLVYIFFSPDEFGPKYTPPLISNCLQFKRNANDILVCKSFPAFLSIWMKLTQAAEKASIVLTQLGKYILSAQGDLVLRLCM